MVVKFQESAANIEENDFVECLAYSKDESVLMTGQLVDDVEPQKVCFWWLKTSQLLKQLSLFITFSSFINIVYMPSKAIFTLQINCIGRFWKPWFYQHVQGFLSARKCGTEYIPLREYYHRHTRSLFWEMQACLIFNFLVNFFIKCTMTSNLKSQKIQWKIRIKLKV